MPADIDIKELSCQQLKDVLAKNNFPPFHAAQISSWIYKKNALSFDSMSDLPLDLRAFLQERFFVCAPKIKEVLTSQDGTCKFAINLSDGNLIEAVFIPGPGRGTLCVSSQVGCRFGCAFCASSSCPWVRNLTCSEILDEILLSRQGSKGTKITHIVFMGIGEPLDNLDNVLKSIRMINASDGFCLGKRRITISTCGIIPGIIRLSQMGLGIELSVSLHACDDAMRSEIMPINNKYPLKDLIPALLKYQEETSRQITFEYILINNFNSAPGCAIKLGNLLRPLDYKLNLISFNAVGQNRFKPAAGPEVLKFLNALKKESIRATLRKPRGGDILAACGQLRAKALKTKDAKNE